jgi:hypothetical protein
MDLGGGGWGDGGSKQKITSLNPLLWACMYHKQNPSFFFSENPDLLTILVLCSIHANDCNSLTLLCGRKEWGGKLGKGRRVKCGRITSRAPLACLLDW